MESPIDSANQSQTISDEQYRVLARIATERGIQVHALIEANVSNSLQPNPDAVRANLLRRVRHLHATGRNDRLIAENMDLPRSTVAAFRNEMNLPNNDPRGRRKSTTNQIGNAA